MINHSKMARESFVLHRKGVSMTHTYIYVSTKLRGLGAP